MSLELLLLGTGTSSALPALSCLLAPQSEKSCFCCRSTLIKDSISGSRNIRNNTSAVLRIPSTTQGERKRSLLIDCGKTFRKSILEYWTDENGLKEIDAILLTHPHADAILGLDDLRSWTLGGVIQKSIEIHCNQTTFDELERMFPYLTDRSQATGGGDVAHLSWKIFEDNKPFEILGVRVTPLAVHHGVFFTKPPTPYYCNGFIFDSTIAYLSDVSNIPESIWKLIGEELELVEGEEKLAMRDEDRAEVEEVGLADEMAKVKLNGNGIKKEKKRLNALVIDCLRLEQFQSHIGLPQAISIARRFGVEKTYLIGFGHATSHDSWVAATTAFSNNAPSTIPLQFDQGTPPKLIREPKSAHNNLQYSGTTSLRVEDRAVFVQEALWRIKSWEGEEGVEGERRGFWVRPGCDGMTIKVGEDGKTSDDIYEI